MKVGFCTANRRGTRASFPPRLVALAGALSLACACKNDPPPQKAPEPEPVAAPKAPVEVDRTPSLVTVLCPQGERPGFFTAAERVLTSARELCDQPRVRLPDARTALGLPQPHGKDAAFVELDVPGAQGAPLALGAAFEVRETDDVAVPGSGRGTVRSLTRTRLGVPHLEIAFERIPPRGRPVLDASGAVIGVVATDTLMLPIDALGPSPDWPRLISRSRDAALAEAREVRRSLEHPALATALVDARGVLHAVLLSRDTAVTELELKLGGCARTVKVGWERFRVAAWYDAHARELFAYLDRYDLDVGLSMATVEVPADGCPAKELTLTAAEPLLRSAPIAKTDQTMAVTGTVPPPEAAPAVPPTAGKPLPPVAAVVSDERTWRARFAQAREAIEDFERELRDKQRYIEQADLRAQSSHHHQVQPFMFTPAERERYDQYKRDVEAAPAQRTRLNARLDDLEREASNASVPREWRR